MTAYEQREADTITRRTLMAHDATTRTLTDDERGLLQRIGRWGAAAYPVQKLGRGWVWGTCPKVFKTKREAVEGFEVYYHYLLDLNGVEAYRRAIAERA